MTPYEQFDFTVDMLFIVDLFVNFISAIEDPETGLPIISLKLIAANYLSGWFWLDLLACLPVQLVEKIVDDGGSNFKLARLARLPRLYRLVRILRMIKMLRLFRKNGIIKDWIDDIEISKGMKRLINAVALVFWMVHLMACFWYLAASLEDNIFNTWVGARGVADADPNYKYFNAFYWAFQTVTTVGYGDFSIATRTEFILTLIWMMIGVNCYTFVIGNVSSMIATLELKEAALNAKLTTLSAYAEKYDIPRANELKIIQHLTLRAAQRGNDEEWDIIFKDLPRILQT